MCAACGGVAAAGDEQVFQLLRQERAIRDVVGLRLNFLRVEVVRAADDGFVRVQVQIPAAGGDGVVEAAGLHQVVLVDHILAEEPPRLAHADPRIRLHEVGLLEARHLALPCPEHRPRIGAALHLGAGEVGGIGRVRGHADAVDVNLAVVVEEHHAGAVVEGQLAGGPRLRERGTAVLAEVADALHVADAEVQRERLHLGVLLEWCARPGSDIRVTGAVNHRVRLDVHEAVLVGDLHGADAPALALHAADERVEQHGEPLLLLADEAVEQQLELEGIADSRVVLGRVRGIGFADTRLGQQLQRDAAHDDAVVFDVRDAIEVGKTDTGDDAAGERSLLHEQHLRAAPRCRQRRRDARATTAADQHISLERFGAERFASGLRGCSSAVQGSQGGPCGCGLDKLPTGCAT